MTYWETVWTFSTANFTISLDVTDEDTDPADAMEFPEDIEFARAGNWHWFAARVRVLWDHNVIGQNHLGCCSYHNLEDFKQDGCFRDMILTAIADARHTVAKFRNSPLKEHH